jgi:hypothetical protein
MIPSISYGYGTFFLVIQIKCHLLKEVRHTNGCRPYAQSFPRTQAHDAERKEYIFPQTEKEFKTQAAQYAGKNAILTASAKCYSRDRSHQSAKKLQAREQGPCVHYLPAQKPAQQRCRKHFDPNNGADPSQW